MSSIFFVGQGMVLMMDTGGTDLVLLSKANYHTMEYIVIKWRIGKRRVALAENSKHYT